MLTKRLSNIGSFYKKGVLEIAFLGINVLFNKIIALLFIPLIQSNLGRDAYILYDYYLTLVTLGTSVFILGMDSGIIRYLEQERTHKSYQQLFSTGAAFGGLTVVLLSAVSLLLLTGFTFFFPNFSFLSLAFIVCIVLNTIVVAFQNYVYSLLRWLGKTHIATVSNIIIPVSSILPSSLYFFFGTNISLYNFLMIYFIGGLLGTFLVLVIFYRIGLFSIVTFNLKDYRTTLQFSLPLGLNSILFNFVRYADRFILAALLGANGIKTPAYADYLFIQRIGQFVASILQLLGSAFLPMMFEQSATVEGRKKNRSFFHLLILSHFPVIIASTLVFFLVLSEMVNLSSMLYYFPLALVGFFAMSDTTTSGIGFFKGNKTKEVFYISFLYLVISICMQAFIITYWGMTGIFYSNTLLAIIYLFAYIMRSEKHFPMFYNWRLLAGTFSGLYIAAVFFILFWQ